MLWIMSDNQSINESISDMELSCAILDCVFIFEFAIAICQSLAYSVILCLICECLFIKGKVSWNLYGDLNICIFLRVKI